MPNLKSFSAFSEERVNPIVITFGRFQPPTIGHEKVINKVASLAKGNNYRIFTSQVSDTKKNPLSYKDKIKFLRKMFPKHGRNIIEDTSVRTIFDALVKLHQQGFTRLVLVVGSDRIEEFNRLLNKYNGEQANHGLFDFKDGIQVVSSGERDPDSDGVNGMSASLMRAAATDNNLEQFTKGLPDTFKDVSALFNAIRTGMGLRESYMHRKHVQLHAVSEERENFVKGNLFVVNDQVRINETKEEGKIVELGPNFVVVSTPNGKVRKWITAVSKI